MEIGRETVLEAPVEEAWDALVDLGAWFGAEARADLVPGGRVEFTWPDGSVRAAVFEEVDPPRVLAFRWLPFRRAPDGTAERAATTRVEFRLEPDPAGARLFVTEHEIGAHLRHAGASA